MTHVLDAGPMIAFLDNETGASEVTKVLIDYPNECFAHVFNLTEIYYIYLNPHIGSCRYKMAQYSNIESYIAI